MGKSITPICVVPQLSGQMSYQIYHWVFVIITCPLARNRKSACVTNCVVVFPWAPACDTDGTCIWLELGIDSCTWRGSTFTNVHSGGICSPSDNPLEYFCFTAKCYLLPVKFYLCNILMESGLNIEGCEQDDRYW